MSLATNGRARPSKGSEMGFSVRGRRGAVWPPMVQIARQSTEIGSPSHNFVRNGYAPDVTALRGLVWGHRPKTEEEVNCVV